MQNLNIPIAFFAGLVSFFAPCMVALLPAYISYVTGVSLQNLSVKGRGGFRTKIILSSLAYVLGFSLVFVILGGAVASIGFFFRSHTLAISRIGGLIILIFGLEFAGILNLPFLANQKQLRISAKMQNFGILRSFLVGIIFATAWTPCVGAVLGSILALAVTSSSLIHGITLLFVYSLGISLPFLLATLAITHIPKLTSTFVKYSHKLTFIAGIILAILGLLLLTNKYAYVNAWIFEVAYKLGYTVR